GTAAQVRAAAVLPGERPDVDALRRQGSAGRPRQRPHDARYTLVERMLDPVDAIGTHGYLHPLHAPRDLVGREGIAARRDRHWVGRRARGSSAATARSGRVMAGAVSSPVNVRTPTVTG